MNTNLVFEAFVDLTVEELFEEAYGLFEELKQRSEPKRSAPTVTVREVTNDPIVVKLTNWELIKLFFRFGLV